MYERTYETSTCHCTSKKARKLSQNVNNSNKKRVGTIQ